VNNSFKLITTVLIIILIALLIWVAFWYFKQPSNSMPINTDYLTTDIINSNNNDTDDVIISGSKDSVENVEKATDKVIPVDTISDEESLLIISDSKTSDSEKQEILDNIDSTLMELLEVVDKVQTVDETRLIIDESEVQK
jgi:uncharacterized membrane protein YukC